MLTNNKKTLILILNLNLPEFSNLLFINIDKNIDKELFDIKILDNGSEIEMRDKLCSKPIQIEKNLFFGGGLQYAFDYILDNQDKYDGLIFLNNDIWFKTNNFFETLVKESKENNYKISSPSIFNMNINNEYHAWKQMFCYNSKVPREAKWVDFVCPYIHIDIIKQYKVPDELKYGFGIDFDICMKCEELGYKVAIFDYLPIIHYQCVTTAAKRCKELPSVEEYHSKANNGTDIYFAEGTTLEDKIFYNRYHDFRNWALNYNFIQ